MLRITLTLLLTPLALFGVIELRSIDFDQSRDDWNIITIELRSVRDDTESGYDNNIKVVPHLSYQLAAGSFTYYRSSAEVLTVKHGDSFVVPFILPGPIVERDRLRAEPFAFYIEIIVDGEALAFSPDFVSDNIRGNAEAIRSLKQRSEGPEGQQNDGILRPFYINPGVLGGNLRGLPIFRRPEGFPVD